MLLALQSDFVEAIDPFPQRCLFLFELVSFFLLFSLWASLVQKVKSRPRCGYQVFSSQLWVKVKTEMGAGVGFAEISREIGNQVIGWFVW